MDIKDVCDAGGEILETVVDAVARNDYSGLSKNVGDTVNRVLNQAEQEIKFRGMEHRSQFSNEDKYKDLYRNGRMTNYHSSKDADSFKTGNYDSIYNKSSYSTAVNRVQNVVSSLQGKKLPATITRTPAGRIIGPIQLGWGVLGTTGFGTVAVTAVVLAASGATDSSGLIALAVVFGILTGCTISDIVRGYGKISLIRRFRHYADLIGDRGYVEVDELSAMAGRKRESVLKDLKKMVKRRMFLQGRFDAQEKTFMLTNEVYEQYRLTENERRRKEAQEQLYRQEVEKQTENIQNEQGIDNKTKKILIEGNDYIRMVRACNEKISDVAMSDKLSRLEQIMQRIFEQVEKNPESADDLHKFMTIYLPTTKKLLNAYVDLDQQNISGENIVNTKKEIEDTLDTINAAFEKLLDSLFEDTAWDISSDISVMKTMMAQEGLTGQDFQMK